MGSRAQPTVAVTAADPIKQERVDWRKTLSDPKEREWLSYLGTEYATMLDKAFDNCLLVNTYEQHVCYLIDFDVLRSHLEPVDPDELDTLSVDYILCQSERPYALPLGALFELIEWLRQFHFGRLTSSTDALNPVDKLARHFIRGWEKIAPSELLSSLMERLDDKSKVLSRLAAFFEDQRFKGVVSSFQKADAGLLNTILSGMRRQAPPGSLRSKLDERDSINLAIATLRAREYRESQVTDQRPGFVLVSQTNAVLNILNNLDISTREGRRVLYDVSTLLGVQGEPVRGKLPVMRPREVMHLEVLGAYESPHEAILKARTFRDDFRDIAGRLDAEIHLYNLVKSRDQYEQRFGPTLAPERDVVADSFVKLAKKMLLQRSVLHDFERLRSTEASVGLARRRQIGLPETAEDEILTRSIEFLDLAKRVTAALDSIAGLTYVVASKDVVNGRCRCFEVRQTNSEDDSHAIFTGEEYQASGADRSSADRFYLIRWPIVCRESVFFASMRAILRPVTSHLKKAAMPKISRLSPNSPAWYEGMVVYTTVDAFSAPMDVIMQWNDRGPARLDDLRRTVNAAASESSSLAVGHDVTIPPITQYRVNTHFGDFAFDVLPPEGTTYRYLSVYSHLDLADVIAGLFARTGTWPVVESKIASVLRDLFENYPGAAAKDGLEK